MSDESNIPAADAASDDSAGKAIRRRAFVDAVMARANLSRPDARTAVDAVLAVLADAVMSGTDLAVPPLGRLHVVRNIAGPRGRQITLRLAPPRPGETAADPLADPAEQS